MKERPTFWSNAMTTTPSAITQELIRLLTERDARGREKYGTTLDRSDLSFEDWAQHAIEEMLDGAAYLQCAIRARSGCVPLPVGRHQRARVVGREPVGVGNTVSEGGMKLNEQFNGHTQMPRSNRVSRMTDEEYEDAMNGIIDDLMGDDESRSECDSAEYLSALDKIACIVLGARGKSVEIPRGHSEALWEAAREYFERQARRILEKRMESNEP